MAPKKLLTPLVFVELLGDDLPEIDTCSAQPLVGAAFDSNHEATKL